MVAGNNYCNAQYYNIFFLLVYLLINLKIGLSIMNTFITDITAPLNELKGLTFENLDKVVNLQLSALEQNTKASLDQLRDVAAISSLDGLKDYFIAQSDIAKQVAERAVEDARALVDLGNSYTNDAQEIVREGCTAERKTKATT